MDLKWIGHEKGMAGIPGIPAKDLSDEELRRRGLDAKALLKTGLYVEDKPKKLTKVEDKAMEE